MANQRESFQNLDRDHGVPVFGKSKGKREEDSSKEPPAGLLRRAGSFPGHPIPDSSTPSSAPRVLLPGSASRSRCLASSAATSWTPALPTLSPTTPLPTPHRPPHWSGSRTRQAPPSPPRDEVGGAFSPSDPSGSVRDRLGRRGSPPDPLLPPPPHVSALSSRRTNPSPGLQTSPITVREGRPLPLGPRHPPE